MREHEEFRTRFPAPCRIALLASVAGVGIAVLAGGVDVRTVSNRSAWISSAAAAETAAQPSGFADFVEKVKPAVISVRVDAATQRTAMNSDDEDAIPFGQGSPFGRFFRRFGFNDMPNGMQEWPRNGEVLGLPRMTAEGSGFSFLPTAAQLPIAMW
jgi:serine protease Do